MQDKRVRLPSFISHLSSFIYPLSSFFDEAFLQFAAWRRVPARLGRRQIVFASARDCARARKRTGSATIRFCGWEEDRQGNRAQSRETLVARECAATLAVSCSRLGCHSDCARQRVTRHVPRNGCGCGTSSAPRPVAPRILIRNDEIPGTRFDPLVSTFGLTAFAPQLSLCADLFTVQFGSDYTFWIGQRRLARADAHPALSPVQSRRIRSGAIRVGSLFPVRGGVDSLNLEP
jgi:hypothetical protein